MRRNAALSDVGVLGISLCYVLSAMRLFPRSATMYAPLFAPPPSLKQQYMKIHKRPG